MSDISDRELAKLIYKLVNDKSIPDTPDFTGEEWAALCEESPMSFELFISCIEKCVDGNYGECYFDIIHQFPEYEDQFSEYLEKNYDMKPMTPEEVEEKLQSFKEDMREKYGEDFI